MEYMFHFNFTPCVNSLVFAYYLFGMYLINEGVENALFLKVLSYCYYIRYFYCLLSYTIQL